MSVSYNLDQTSSSFIRPSNTTAYAAGDVISEVTTNNHFTFKLGREGRADENGCFSFTIERGLITSSAAVSPAPDLELWLFDTDIAEVADNSAFAPTDAEMLTWIGTIDFPLSDWKTAGANAGCAAERLAMTIKASTSTSGNIYGQLVIRNAYVPTSAEVYQVTLFTQRD